MHTNREVHKRKRTPPHRLTDVEVRFLEKNVVGNSRAELTEMFNCRFGHKFSVDRLNARLKYKKLKSGLGNKAIGSERINVYGYVEIKIHHFGRWQLKHHVIWENVHGIIPKGHIILFADRNPLNLSLDNLILVSRAELRVMNKFNLISTNRQLTEIGKSIATIKLLIHKREKEEKTRRRTHAAE